MVLVFTVVSAAIEWMGSKSEQLKVQKAEEAERQKQREEEAEQVREGGTDGRTEGRTGDIPTNVASVNLVMGCSKIFFSLFQHLPWRTNAI